MIKDIAKIYFWARLCRLHKSLTTSFSQVFELERKIAEIKDGRHQTQGFWVSTISFLLFFLFYEKLEHI